MSEPWLAVLNPAAGGGRTLRAWPRLAAALVAAAVPFELVTSREPGEATRLAERAAERGQTRFLAVGGDGTLHEVLNGLMGAGRPATLAVAPLGTGNDWARGAGVPRDPSGIAAMLRAGRASAHDVGELDYTTATGRERRYYLNVAGAGYDAFVLEHRARRGPRALGYLAALAAGLWRYQPPRFEVRADGARQTGRFFVTFVALGRYCGGGMQFAPQARPDDGLLDLVTIDHVGALAALTRLPRIYTGRVLTDRAVHWQQARRVEIDAEPPSRLEADGQLLGTTPATVVVHPGAIAMIAP